VSAETSKASLPAATEAFAPVRAEPRPELLAPGTPAHRVLAEPLIAVYGLPGFLKPLFHPATAAATGARDKVFTDPDADAFDFLARLRDTIEMISAVAHAGDEADHVAHAMRELHRGIAGADRHGDSYHAWSRDTWTWNWAAIVAGWMRGYDVLRGFPTEEFGEQAYLGMVEVGRRFGVLGMPASYEEFLVEWPRHRDRLADGGSETIQRVVALMRADGLPPPRVARRLPLPVWAAVTLPVWHVLRMPVVIGLDDDERALLGFDARRSDQLLAATHARVWRIVLPRAASYRVGLGWLAARRRFGTPVWRTRYSAATLGRPARAQAPQEGR
jgi:uncharacterized protein (DUF2236 family)